MFVYRNHLVLVVILIYVDDILVVGNSLPHIQPFIYLLNTLFALKDLGDLSYFLNIEVNCSAGSLCLSQAKYISVLLIHTDMVSCKPTSTPMDAGISSSVSDGPLFDNSTLYHSIVGALQYCTLTCPDLSFAVNKVFQYFHALIVSHWHVLKRILRYLKTTNNLGLHFTKSSHNSLTCYTNVDWANCPDDRRSTSGYCVFIGANLVS